MGIIRISQCVVEHSLLIILREALLYHSFLSLSCCYRSSITVLCVDINDEGGTAQVTFLGLRLPHEEKGREGIGSGFFFAGQA